MSATEDPSIHNYSTISVPKSLLDEIDQVVKRGLCGYKSRSEFVKESIRMRLKEVYAKTPPPPPLPPLEHFNLDEHGVRILDRTMGSKTSNGRIIDVFFKPDKVYCDNCQSNNCQHVKFAMELETVQEILNKKGWEPKA